MQPILDSGVLNRSECPVLEIFSFRLFQELSCHDASCQELYCCLASQDVLGARTLDLAAYLGPVWLKQGLPDASGPHFSGPTDAGAAARCHILNCNLVFVVSEGFQHAAGLHCLAASLGVPKTRVATHSPQNESFVKEVEPGIN